MPSPYSAQRSVISYGSRGSSAGKCTSCAPAAVISSRMMRSIFAFTRRPSGSQANTPGAWRRM